MEGHFSEVRLVTRRMISRPPFYIRDIDGKVFPKMNPVLTREMMVDRHFANDVNRYFRKERKEV